MIYCEQSNEKPVISLLRQLSVFTAVTADILSFTAVFAVILVILGYLLNYCGYCGLGLRIQKRRLGPVLFVTALGGTL